MPALYHNQSLEMNPGNVCTLKGRNSSQVDFSSDVFVFEICSVKSFSEPAVHVHTVQPKEAGRLLAKVSGTAVLNYMKKRINTDDLMQLYSGTSATLPEGYAMFCGTLAVKGAIEPAEVFAIELEDPVLRRKLTHSYKVMQLPVEG